MLGNSVVLAIAGNKIDLEKNRVVKLEDAEKYVIDLLYLNIINIDGYNYY